MWGVINFHGGGGIAGNCEDITDCCRYAVECNVTVVSPGYRLAPEHKHPHGITDGYAAIKWITSWAPSIGIDPSRVAALGQSGGGYICSGAMKLLDM